MDQFTSSLTLEHDGPYLAFKLRPREADFASEVKNAMRHARHVLQEASNGHIHDMQISFNRNGKVKVKISPIDCNEYICGNPMFVREKKVKGPPPTVAEVEQRKEAWREQQLEVLSPLHTYHDREYLCSVAGRGLWETATWDVANHRFLDVLLKYAVRCVDAATFFRDEEFGSFENHLANLKRVVAVGGAELLLRNAVFLFRTITTTRHKEIRLLFVRRAAAFHPSLLTLWLNDVLQDGNISHYRHLVAVLLRYGATVEDSHQMNLLKDACECEDRFCTRPACWFFHEDNPIRTTLCDDCGYFQSVNVKHVSEKVFGAYDNIGISNDENDNAVVVVPHKHISNDRIFDDAHAWFWRLLQQFCSRNNFKRFYLNLGDWETNGSYACHGHVHVVLQENSVRQRLERSGLFSNNDLMDVALLFAERTPPPMSLKEVKERKRRLGERVHAEKQAREEGRQSHVARASVKESDGSGWRGRGRGRFRSYGRGVHNPEPTSMTRVDSPLFSDPGVVFLDKEATNVPTLPDEWNVVSSKSKYKDSRGKGRDRRSRRGRGRGSPGIG